MLGLRLKTRLKLTPLVQEKNPQEQVSINAFAFFRFSAQFNSGTDHSDKLKTPKLISNSLFEPLVLLYNQFFFPAPSKAS